ncbi:Chromosome (plasmid) partitioning protein ParA [Geitlerinema sp. FC II]|nr:Chromosome (plasmid) partitioning protein ParA [Geitlerinema sp. FC II]
MSVAIVAIASPKGGVGKTTSAIALAGLLAEKQSCLAVDLDPQGNLTMGLGVELEPDQIGSYDVMTQQLEAEEPIVDTECGVDLLPTDSTLAEAEKEISDDPGRFFVLKRQLDPLKAKYRTILIDCPPNMGLLTLNALAAADAVLVPVQCQFFSLRGLDRLLEEISQIRSQYNLRLRLLGVLPTMAENTIITRKVLAELKKRHENVSVFYPVPKSVKFAEATFVGKPIHRYTKNAKLVKPYERVMRAIVPRSQKTPKEYLL